MPLSSVIAPAYRDEALRAGLWLGFAVLSLLLFMAVPALHFALPKPLNVSVHTFMETASIVVCVLVFSIGAASLRESQHSGVALLGSVFLGVALLDFVHVLSFDGMPELITPSGSGKAISFFLAARLLVALALIVFALLPWRFQTTLRLRLGLLAAVLGLAGMLIVLGFQPGVKELFFVPGQGLTPLKVGLEWALAGLYALAALAFLPRLRKPQEYPAVDLALAACLMAVSEVCLSLYAQPQDQYNNLGHFWKVVAYLFIWRAFFRHLVREPYLDLEQARAELRESAASIAQLNATLEDRVQLRTFQLQAANLDLEVFSYTVAHDLRGPLGAIQGFATALGEQLPDASERQRHYLGRIHANTARMRDMITALLDLARMPGTPPTLERLHLGDMARELVAELAQQEPGRHVELVLGDGLALDSDPGRIRMVMANLLSNAWKYTRLRGDAARIEVGVSTAPEGRSWFVRDNGEGFDPDEAPRLFGLFQRLHPEDGHPGHGIGLFNVRRIVSSLGGKVWVQSRPGQGATFFFTLPSSG